MEWHYCVHLYYGKIYKLDSLGKTMSPAWRLHISQWITGVMQKGEEKGILVGEVLGCNVLCFAKKVKYNYTELKLTSYIVYITKA